MPFEDFREFIQLLEENGELITVDRPINLQMEVGQALQKSASISGPAIQFNQNGTAFPLIGGIYNSRKKTLLAFQTDEASIFKKILDGLAHPIDPIVSSLAVTHENIILADAVDLATFPIPKYSPSDWQLYHTRYCC